MSSEIKITIKDNKKLSPQEKLRASCNKLIQDVKALNERLGELKKVLPDVAVKVEHEIVSLESEHSFLMLELLENVEAACNGRFKIGKKDTESLRYFITSRCEDYLRMFPKESEIYQKSEVLFNRNSDMDYDSVLSQQDEFSNDIMSNIFGIDFDSKRAREEGHDYFEELYEDEEEQEEDETEYNFSHASKKVEGSKTEHEEYEKLLNKDLRSLYTELSKACHPDLTQDEDEKEVRTEQMKRISGAYESNNLIELLSIRTELNQSNDFDDKTLKRFINLLKEQKETVKWELEELKHTSLYSSFFTKNEFDEKKFNKVVKQKQVSVETLKREIISSETDSFWLKMVAKEIAREMKTNPFF